MSLTWLIIAVALFAAFGPLFWMMPSRSDRRLAKMRTRARSHGIHVEITQLDDLAAEPHARVNSAGVKLEPKVMCAAYRLGMQRLAKAAPQWQVLRKPGANDGPIDGWTGRRARPATRRTGSASAKSYASCRPTRSRARRTRAKWPVGGANERPRRTPKRASTNCMVCCRTSRKFNCLRMRRRPRSMHLTTPLETRQRVNEMRGADLPSVRMSRRR